MPSDRKSLIFHIDVNSAFLSWSAIKLLKEGGKVDLRQIPSIVGGDQETRHGIVVAKSIPAKKYGIKTADTVASAFARCPDLVMVPPDHAYYREMSHAWKTFLSELFPVMQSASVDEVYVLFEPDLALLSDPLKMAEYIRQETVRRFGFTVNVGISEVKVLAKMASDFQKPDRTHTLYQSEIREKMWPLPIGELFMCGKSTAARLESLAIKTIGDLAQSDPAYIEGLLKKHGRLLWQYANGIDPSPVRAIPEKVKGVGNSTTLAKNAETREEALTVIKALCRSVSQRLKKKGFLAGEVSVEIKYSDFHTESHQMQLDKVTDKADELYRQSVRLFDALWKGEPIRLLGVRTGRLTEEEEPYQMTIFDYERIRERDEKERKMQSAMEAIRGRFGQDAIQKGMK